MKQIEFTTEEYRELRRAMLFYLSEDLERVPRAADSAHLKLELYYYQTEELKSRHSVSYFARTLAVLQLGDLEELTEAEREEKIAARVVDILEEK